jgi:flagellar biosynthesis protein FlhB
MAGGADDGGEKKHQATPRKLRTAREHGQVSQSQELTSAVSLLAAGGAVVLATPAIAKLVADLWLGAERIIVSPTLAAALGLALASMQFVLIASVTILGVSGGVAAVCSRLQTGPVFSLEPVKPQLSKLNPVQGAKRIFSARSLVRLAILCGKTAIIGMGVYLVVAASFGDAVRVVYGGEGAALAVATKALTGFITWCGLAFLIIGLADLLYQRFQFAKDQMMTTQELQREAKDQEGNPHYTAQRRQLAAQPTPQQQFQYLRYAAVVLTGSDGRTIAIYHNASQSPVPFVIVRGQGVIGEEILQRARGLRVPVVQEYRLADALYPRSAADAPVPDGLTAAVLDVVRRVRQAPP